jgi:glyoxylase-like metal-dependent hydrolase (beta-lactamase superfamily II)
MNRLWRVGAILLLVVVGTVGARMQAPPDVRLYVLDGGVLESDPERYNLTPAEVQSTQLGVTAFLVMHPEGTLLWDTGAVPDDAWTPTGEPVARRIFLSDGRLRPITVTRSITEQIASAGVLPDEITYLALSHSHWDHTANANRFTAATWLVPQAEYDLMLPATPPPVAQPSTFAALRSSRTVVVDGRYDVFGDGTVLLLPTPGHTPGHQSLYVRLANTGGIVLSGDLYHYPEEYTLDRLPTAEVDLSLTEASRAQLDAFMDETGATLWIQHDRIASRDWRKSPAFYD